MRAILCCLLLTFGVNASAQRWTLQAFAYAGEARAEAVAERLRAVGFDAYTETLPGSALTQVRIGCFGAQADAAALAQDVRERVAADALVVPLREGADVTVCVAREPGFIPPLAWGLESASETQVTFWLEADGRRTITFDGERWTLEQGGEAAGEPQPSGADPLTDLLAAPAPTGLPATFRATRSRGLPLVRADLGGGSLLVAAGTLLWRSDRAAVVQQGADVFALRLTRP